MQCLHERREGPDAADTFELGRQLGLRSAEAVRSAERVEFARLLLLGF